MKVMAECKQGNGDRAFEYYRAFMPSAYNDHAEIRRSEPYVLGQTTYSESPRAGVCCTSWLTGAATWAYFSASQAILGIQPQVNGLRIDPCIPHDWPGFTAMRRFRGKEIDITVKNPAGVCKGVAALKLNGKVLPGNLLPVEQLADHNQVEVILG